MSARSPEVRFDVASRTRALVAEVERFLAGRSTRAELLRWAELVRFESGREAFTGHAAADELWTCLLGIEEQMGEPPEPVVRAVDLLALLNALRLGDLFFDAEELAYLRLSVGEVARRVGGQVIRLPIDGVGWQETVRFASPATGRPFAAVGALRPPAAEAPGASIHVARRRQSAEEPAQELADLLDTLEIDASEVAHAAAETPGGWRLVRADDNGNQALVATFSGYAKARAELARYEARQHKQTYWLEPTK